MWIFRLIFFSLIGYSELSITFPKPEETNETTTAERYIENKSLQHHVATLGLNTLSHIPIENNSVILSPLNIYSCLGVIGLGASGETRAEISKVLGPAGSNNTINAIINITQGISYASAAFLDIRTSVKHDFLDASLRDFQSPVVKVNFSNSEESNAFINSWVSNHTNGSIPQLLPGPLPLDTKAVIVSTLFFHGKWLYPFFPPNTKTGKFNIDEKTSIEVQLMAVEATLPLIRSSNFHAIGLPYEGNGLTMHLVLPRQQGMTAVKEVLAELHSDYVKLFKKDNRMEEVIALVPKFKFDGRLQLKATLRKLGLNAMFDQEKADFSNLVEQDGSLTFVSEIFHNVHFEMDEVGTTAAAVTAAVFTKSSKFVFRANRPFIFFIAHESGLVLFSGVITRPTA